MSFKYEVSLEGGPLASAFGTEGFVDSASVYGFSVNLKKLTTKKPDDFKALRSASQNGQITPLCKSCAFRVIDNTDAANARVVQCAGIGVPSDAEDPKGLLKGTVQLYEDTLYVQFTPHNDAVTAEVLFDNKGGFEDVNYGRNDVQKNNYGLTAQLSTLYSKAVPEANK